MTVKRKIVVLGILLVAIGVVLFVTRKSIHKEGLRAAFDAEFLTRPDGYKGLTKKYGFTFPIEPIQMEIGLMYKSCADGAVDVICGFATDGRIPAYNLVILEDDKNFFPPYDAAPLVRAGTLKKYPELEKIINRLAGLISTEKMQSLNYEVDEKHRPEREVAREFLESEGLISGKAPAPKNGRNITIGGKAFTEQEILGEMLAILIEDNSDIAVTRSLNLGGTMICFNALKAGDLDLYVEYTGTGLVNILKRDVIRDSQKTYDVVKKEFFEKWDLAWLKPLGLNNTYTLTMRKEQTERLGIKTISDLAEYVNSHKK